MIEPVLKDDAFLADIDALWGAPGPPSMWWLGQSGYLIQHDHFRALIDPYLSDSLTKKYAGTDKPHVRMSARVVAPESLTHISLITSSHAHTDHLDPDTLRLVREANDYEPDPWTPLFVAPRAVEALAEQRFGRGVDCALSDGESREWSSVKITAVPAAHDRLDRDDRGDSLYLGYVLRVDDWSIYHSGDTVVYEGMVERLRSEAPIDIAILPINGKVGNMGGRDAARLAKEIGAKVVIPCHYDMFEFNTADPNDEFIPECQRLGQPYRVLRLGERFSSDEIAALKKD